MTKEEVQKRLADEGWSIWHPWDGVDGLKYARRKKTSPPVVVRACDWEGVLEQIEEKEGARR